MLPKLIHGNKRNHHAHRTDVLRLQILDAHDGAYLEQYPFRWNHLNGFLAL